MLLLQLFYNVIELDCYESLLRIFSASSNNDDNAFVQDLALELIICRKRKLSHVPVSIGVADIATHRRTRSRSCFLMCLFSLGSIFINGCVQN